ncbi:EAL domain-containing protein [Alteromonas sp. McT4-15]|uniref:two-component system response regulator n=1 Tax=Alteromonas sp. McT4-15 TaxID=2881256 RepID=UPI001CF8BC39|nr:EAL domain-containing protein [Alteromonas sp. McT4-15]MCB4436424.1 EAL domain-containing protein [Alteromonas sp. McT4-15]
MSKIISGFSHGTEKQTVVIIDDEPSTLLLLEHAVSAIANTITCSNSSQALDIIVAQQPDLIILDISMPELSGFELCERVKARHTSANIPVIFVTSNSDASNERRALTLGAIDFISKPIDIELCRLRVSNHLLMSHQKRMLAQVNQALETEKQQLSVTLRSIADGVISTDENGLITFINPVAERLTGYLEKEALGKPVHEVMNLRDVQTSEAMLNPALYALEVKRPVAMAYNTTLMSRHGDAFRVEDTASPIIDDKGNLLGAVIVFQDVSETVEMAVRMTHITNHDQLTGLPNRVLLHDRIVQAISRSKMLQQSIALLIIDIDNFKYLNDSLGHKVGDTIIQSIAERLASIVGNNATLARVGGDEFACLLTDIGSGFSADSIAMACLQAGRVPIDLNGKLHQLSLSIGISLFPQDASNAEEMMRHADTAMYRSKTKGKDAFSFFSKDLQLAMHRRVELDILLRNAIENNQLAIFLQPKYSFADRSVVGAESLVRLYDENGKVIGPDEFIPLAEENGLIHQLGCQVLKKSCVLVAECHKRGQALKLAVNVAAKQLANPRFAKEVEQIITATGIDASMIELEVTESALMHDFEQTKEMLNALASLGVSIALDDFGTGYSSLSYLRQFPLDVLKIDRSFVIDMDQEQQAFDIVSAIVQLALSLDLKIVAEGIENEAQFEALEKLGCHLGQGYLLCKPVAVDEFLVCFANTQPMEKVFY